MTSSIKPALGYHLLAFLTVLVWGTTFISTKVLIFNGLTPAMVMFLRFSLAYLCLLVLTGRKLRADSWRDEALFLLSGMTGGSLYFMTENTALKLSLVSSVALIVCTAPIMTAILYYLVHKQEKVRKNLIWGSLTAFAGVTVVIYSGGLILHLHPVGDFLALSAAFMWACYSLVSKGLISRYSSMFVTRKVFFYGLLTIVPFLILEPDEFHPEILARPVVFGNLLFLSLIASMLGYISWNIATKHLGVVRVTTYIYFSPVVSIVAAWFFLGEKVPWPAWIGAVAILSGVWVAEKGLPRLRKMRPGY